MLLVTRLGEMTQISYWAVKLEISIEKCVEFPVEIHGWKIPGDFRQGELRGLTSR
jgi:hypothetical protein